MHDICIQSVCIFRSIAESDLTLLGITNIRTQLLLALSMRGNKRERVCILVIYLSDLPTQLVYKVNHCIHEWVWEYEDDHSDHWPFHSIFPLFYFLIISNGACHVTTTNDKSSNSEQHAEGDESINKLLDSFPSFSWERGISRISWVYKFTCIFTLL